MDKEYKQSVKGSLTKRLILIILCSVFILITIIVVIQVTASQQQSVKTAEYLITLQVNQLKG